METRANYVLIGAFTLAGLLGIAGFLLWLANVQVNRQFAYYDVLFDNVAGLSAAGAVRYNGLPVGQVVGLELDDDDPSKVRVRLEVDASTPIKTDTTAQLQSQGVTGVSYVALSGGSPDAELLPDDGLIVGERSALQSLFEGAPELLNEAITLVEDLHAVVNEENREAVSTLLANLSSASGRLDNTLSDFESLSGDLSSAAREVANFTDRLGQLSDTAEETLTTATETLTIAQDTVKSATTALQSAQTAFDTADGLMQNQLTDFIESGTDVAQTLTDTVETLEPSAVETLQAARDLAATRVPGLIDRVEQSIGVLETNVQSVSTDFSGILEEYRQVGETAQARLEQSKSSIESFNTLAADLSETAQKIGGFTDRLTELSYTAETTLTTVTDTLDTAKAAVGTVESTLDSARGAFDTADGLMQDQLTALVETGTSTLQSLEPTVSEALLAARAYIADRLPALTTQVQDTVAALDVQIENIGSGAVDLMSRYEAVGETAQARLDQTETAIAAFETATVEAKEALETINATVQDKLPQLMTDLADATSTANRVIDQIGTEVANVSGHLDSLSVEGVAALQGATETFSNANDTLSAITGAMGAAQDTMAIADEALKSINQVVDEDIDEIANDIREAAAAFSGTVERVAGNVDRISTEILDASTSASNLLGTVDGIVQQNSRQVSDFMRVGLPQLQRFIEEARRLVGNLDRLVDRIERDPARFFLGTQSREFR
ncbi:MAG: MlaD family protein [Paracoccaceae bacterium]